MSTTDGALWPDEPVPAGVAPGPSAQPIEQECATLRAELEEANDRVRRLAAEVENTRKRTAIQMDSNRRMARADTAAAWLPVLDNLERAVRAGADACESSAFLAGLEALRDQAVSVMRELGFERHSEVGVPFDPYRHEAVGVNDEADAEPGSVVEVVQPGYGDGERQLRPARVLVAGQRR
jgi:molecular chaperone GrpE